MDYSQDAKKYGKLDKILNPKGDFSNTTLEQIRLHKSAYKKAKKVSPRDKIVPPA